MYIISTKDKGNTGNRESCGFLFFRKISFGFFFPLPLRGLSNNSEVV